MKKIGVVGTGYVGLVQGVILAEFGMSVLCMDVDRQKIQKLNAGILPIYEPGLGELMEKNVRRGRLRFTWDMQQTVQESEVIFIAVGTPPQEDGSADLRYVQEAAQQIGRYLDGYKVIVDKSTVPVGTGRKVQEIIRRELEKRGEELSFDVVSNPEFLREGKAVRDCLTPDRVVIGTESERAAAIMKQVYDVLYINQTPFLFTNLETAELVKYASNAFLAVKISFINEMALLAEKGGSECAGNRPGNGDGRQNFSKIPACGAGVWRLLLSKGYQSSRRNGAAKWRADDGDRGRDCSKRKAKEKNVPAHFGCAGTAEGAHHCRLGAFL